MKPCLRGGSRWGIHTVESAELDLARTHSTDPVPLFRTAIDSSQSSTGSKPERISFENHRSIVYPLIPTKYCYKLSIRSVPRVVQQTDSSLVIRSQFDYSSQPGACFPSILCRVLKLHSRNLVNGRRHSRCVTSNGIGCGWSSPKSSVSGYGKGKYCPICSWSEPFHCLCCLLFAILDLLFATHSTATAYRILNAICC
jgi:hypothetical protein